MTIAIAPTATDIEIPDVRRAMNALATRLAKATALADNAGQWAKATGARGKRFYGVPSTSVEGRLHLVTRDACSCIGFANYRRCQHHDAVTMHLERVRRARLAEKAAAAMARDAAYHAPSEAASTWRVTCLGCRVTATTQGRPRDWRCGTAGCRTERTVEMRAGAEPASASVAA